ncbi:MAG: hypothetical protein K9K63_02690 [Desulfotignum sp.]|nr:hypothetical protein [Desulfotignum sp.]MCF8086591.1 hypothetical protein [Desulfotignum sp.]MCF8136197.1 hypothetical protein [Desulfotignum sp.]
MNRCKNSGPRDDETGLEDLKNRFLAAIYRKDAKQIQHIYLRIVDIATQGNLRLNENCEKILRQIQTAFLRFHDVVVSLQIDLSPPFHELKTLLSHRVRTRQAHVTHIDFKYWQTRINLDAWQMDRVFENAITIQLTSGCSHFCRRCNEWAIPGVRSHFSFQAAEAILDRLTALNNTDPALYGASDPLDWEHGPYTLADLLIPLARCTRFSLLTKMPRNKKTTLLRLIHHQIPLSISVTDRNRDRIAALEADTGIELQKQHDSDDLLIPAGLDEDFTEIKSSITDAYGTEITPEGVYIIIPTFTSALYPMGHKKLRVTRKTTVFPKKKIGRQALLVDYFKPLEVIGEPNRPFHLPGLLGVQVETLLLDTGSMDLSPPGMRNLKEYFTIFDEPARKRRKQMTPSVLRGLKYQFFPSGRYHTLKEDQKQQYRRKIAAHLDFCKKPLVIQSRMHAAAFFLDAVLGYLAGHDAQKQIIARLILAEAQHLESKYGPIAGTADPKQMFSTAEHPFFDMFRYYVTGLVFDRHTQGIRRFIQTHPAVYDPILDRFTPAPSDVGVINGCT